MTVFNDEFQYLFIIVACLFVFMAIIQLLFLTPHPGSVGITIEDDDLDRRVDVKIDELIKRAESESNVDIVR